MNLEQDFEDIQTTARRVGWCEEEEKTKLWKQLEGDEQCIVCLVAEWISLTEMKALQSACLIVSIKAREKEYGEMSREWQQYLMGKEESPAM